MERVNNLTQVDSVVLCVCSQYIGYRVAGDGRRDTSHTHTMTCSCGQPVRACGRAFRDRLTVTEFCTTYYTIDRTVLLSAYCRYMYLPAHLS